ncbi:fanconi-associated nuclease 1-like [Paramacrobiotus metropolitanus]|uniref:fanconi-associated nuclease 1-like n=1 Tax=Paramacrobiotus metropolitanus TaxID=2943436 RepID=UPI002445AA63|nr:fanconi-associated nuclease 1-like [Paramacrobiotus metropolitanus]
METENEVTSTQEDCAMLDIQLPYYLQNFNWIVKTVCSDAEFQHLFSAEQSSRLSTIACFDALPLNAQKLYVRLYLRKYAFLPRNRIKYDEEFGGQDAVSDLLNALAEAGFLDDELCGTLLDATLVMLSLPQLRELCKIFRVGNGTNSKKELLTSILAKCRQQRTPFGQPLAEIIRQKAVSILGKVYRVEETRRSLFNRIFLFFRLTAGYTNIMADNPIFGLLQLKLTNTKYPDFVIQTDAPLFRSFEQFTMLDVAQQCLEEIELAWMERNFMGGQLIYEKTLPLWESIVKEKEISDEVIGLPRYLRKFRPGYYYTKVMEKGLECLERMGKIRDAIHGYQQLLEQRIYVPHHRGSWYNRLSILMPRADKNFAPAAGLLLKGIEDVDVRPYQKLELFGRLKRTSKNAEDVVNKDQITEMAERFLYKHAPASIVCGKRCATENKMGKSVFIGAEDGVVVGSVEELALSHYRKNGYPEGVHVEGSIIASLYGLLFWDVIYAEGIPNVFRSKFQVSPLDLGCPSFFTSRQANIQRRHESISSSSLENVITSISEIWHKHHEIQSVVQWDILASLDCLISFVQCFRPNQLAEICQRFASDYGAVRAGFPDLTIWNPEDKLVKFVEVKGPNDRLSFKQILWIDFLLSIDVPVEVCHVRATGAKRKSALIATLSEDEDDCIVIE